MTKCLNQATQLAWHLTPTNKLKPGPPKCQRPTNHHNCHHGQGWIWTHNQAQFNQQGRDYFQKNV